jgi:hypothetical protein
VERRRSTKTSGETEGNDMGCLAVLRSGAAETKAFSDELSRTQP